MFCLESSFPSHQLTAAHGVVFGCCGFVVGSWVATGHACVVLSDAVPMGVAVGVRGYEGHLVSGRAIRPVGGVGSTVVHLRFCTPVLALLAWLSWFSKRVMCCPFSCSCSVNWAMAMDMVANVVLSAAVAVAKFANASEVSR